MYEDEKILGCWQEGFSKTYLGLPLSNEKLKLSLLLPSSVRLIGTSLVGKRLYSIYQGARCYQTWSSQARSRLTYPMGPMIVPLGILKAMDDKRQAFMWSHDTETSGAQWLVNWEQ